MRVLLNSEFHSFASFTCEMKEMLIMLCLALKMQQKAKKTPFSVALIRFGFIYLYSQEIYSAVTIQF